MKSRSIFDQNEADANIQKHLSFPGPCCAQWFFKVTDSLPCLLADQLSNVCSLKFRRSGLLASSLCVCAACGCYVKWSSWLAGLCFGRESRIAFTLQSQQQGLWMSLPVHSLQIGHSKFGWDWRCQIKKFEIVLWSSKHEMARGRQDMSAAEYRHVFSHRHTCAYVHTYKYVCTATHTHTHTRRRIQTHSAGH